MDADTVQTPHGPVVEREERKQCKKEAGESADYPVLFGSAFVGGRCGA